MAKVKKTFEGVVKYDSEDGGQALIATINAQDQNSSMFVRLQSWTDGDQNSDDGPEHPEAELFRGKKVRITFEVIE